ncbi:MAG: glycosyl transferase family 2 [Magnetococcales bacterium]|nr:glycosyl transferase family 2 [Magnetococcales bacterium]HIJ84653.1 glycosyltransferase family 2 protein [Magnetococcales bacterium]
MSQPNPKVTVVLPAFNEAQAIGAVIQALRKTYPEWEILVVDDGSTDQTREIAGAAGARVVGHPKNMGNGAAVKTGARHARGRYLVFMDADGQHGVELAGQLMEHLDKGYDMVVGARSMDTHAGLPRRLGNAALNRFASLMTGQSIVDLTSGVRAVHGASFKRFLYLLPNGFSYPTTITMAFIRSGLSVVFHPIRAKPRQGVSKIKFFRDGSKFLIIIMKVVTLYSPMRIFLPVSLTFFFTALGWYIHVYALTGRFTNMPVLLFTVSVMIFLIGLVSEQVTALHLSVAQVGVENEKHSGNDDGEADR